MGPRIPGRIFLRRAPGLEPVGRGIAPRPTVSRTESAADSRNTIRFVSRERRAPRTSLMGRRGALCRARKAPRRCLAASGSLGA